MGLEKLSRTRCSEASPRCCWSCCRGRFCSLLKACQRKVRDTAEACRREGIVFLPFAMETLGGLHSGATAQVKQLASALARCKGLEEGEMTSQLFGRLSLTLMRANAMLLSTRHQDADFLMPEVDGVE